MGRVSRLGPAVVQHRRLALGQKLRRYLHRRVFALPGHEHGDVRVPHGGEGVVFHMGLVEGNAVYIEQAVLHRPPVYRQGGTQNREALSQSFQHGVHHRADIALFCGVKGGAVFQIKPLHAVLPKPFKGFQRVLYRGPHRGGSGFQGDHNRVGIHRQVAFGNFAVQNRSTACTPQEGSRIAGTGKIICHTADFCHNRFSLLFRIRTPAAAGLTF